MSVSYEETLLPMTGIILAGGKSSRMGRNKALIEWDGMPLIERSLAIFSRVFAEVMISSNHPELYSQYGIKVVKDNYLDMGPMGGLEACLREANFEYAFFAACDMPFLDAEVIRFMADRLNTEKILVPKIEGKVHPLHAFYHKDCVNEIDAHLKDGRFKLTKFVEVYGGTYLTDKDFIDFPKIRQNLSNMNTPEDFSRLKEL